MHSWQVWLTMAAVLAASIAPYGLHRLCLWLERRGWLYYRHCRPSSSPLSCFVALQQVLEPPARHVQELHTRPQTKTTREAPAAAESRGADA
jgi:hypothetical protein